ncbi:MAG: type VI secretion system ATPase TssH [Alphaproteobacteria bacterium]|nr:type VI secretion system ATPase TssH [Alphaproteobacteria bacterium]
MADISRGALFGRLNPTALKSLENATTFCKMRGNPYVELVHWLHQMLQDQRNDLAAIRSKFGIDDARLAQDVVEALNALPRGATAISDFSPLIEELAERAWIYASLAFSAAKVRTGHLVVAALKTPSLRNALQSISLEFRKINAETLSAEFAQIVAPSSEADVAASSAPAGDSGDGAGTLGGGGDGKALAQYSIDLTEKARKGEIETIIGRDAEIRQMIDILLRRRQNNPILTGEAGVGKTAVVEGFAKRIVDGDVPPSMKDVSLKVLDIGLLQAGASMKGEFEKRLRAVIDEVEASEKPIILFIDEIHTLVGAGGTAGTGDAANLLKPALARGNLRTIGATTWAEYRKYIEKDPALTRRFQVVNVKEPETAVAVAMIRNVAKGIAKHHDVIVLDEAIAAAVVLSQRYVPARQLPDKAVSLLDTACARVAVSQHATPAALEDAKRRIEILDMEIEMATRERQSGFTTGEKLDALAKDRDEASARVAELEARLASEKAAIAKIATARDALVKKREAGEDDTAEQAALDAALEESRTAQGDSPMVFAAVDRDAVAAIVAEWTGVPIGRMVKDDLKAILTIADRLKERVIGQDHAMDAIAKRLQTSRAKLDNPDKPIGVFMLCGPSGVGKTETAHALADLMYGGQNSLIVINMSEFQEAHTVSTLKGAPPGYIGYGEGGVLTEAVRRRPYSVVLLDEIEKAHSDVHEMFFQVFDKGHMEDGEGRMIDFRNTLILLTSNVGTEVIATACEDEETKPDSEALAKALRPKQLEKFPPALLGRLVTIPYFPLSNQMLGSIVRLQLDRIVKRVAANQGIELKYGQDVIDLIVSRCTEVESGGRMIDTILTNTLLPQISVELLTRQMSGTPVKSITVRAENGSFAYDYA